MTAQIENITLQLATRIEIREKDELGDSGDLILSGRIFGNTAEQIQKRVATLRKLVDTLDMEIWFNEDR